MNHRAVKAPVIERGYLVLDREWKRGDRVELDLADAGRARRRQPAGEGRPGAAGHSARADRLLPGAVRSEPSRSRRFGCRRKPQLKAAREPGLLGGVVTITGEARAASEQNWRRNLYQPAAPASRVALKAIPYYAWDNRQPGAMKVWLPVAPPVLPARGLGSASQGHRQLRQRQLPAAGHQRRRGAQEQRRAAGRPVPLVAAQRHRGMGPIHLEDAGAGQRREGLLVR